VGEEEYAGRDRVAVETDEASEEDENFRH
jgi:hypothetical protein